jgi:hypothetical protein
MIARIWRTEVDVERSAEYDRFASERSLPMFSRHAGFRGAVLYGRGTTRYVLTLWDGPAAACALEASADYRETVAAISRAGFLCGEQGVERFDVSALSGAAML